MIRNMSYRRVYTNIRNIRSLNHEKLENWVKMIRNMSYRKMIRNMSYRRVYTNIRITTY